MRYLVLDTNVFVQDFRMEGAAFSALLNNYKVVADSVIIPKVVYQETINQFSKKLEIEANALNKASKNITRLTGVAATNIVDTDGIIESYIKHFDSKFKSIEHEITEYPDISHEKIAAKAIKRLKPFKSTGEGYCDALIWETILQLLVNDTDSNVIFITNNKKDFLEGDSLSRQLKAELDDSDISQDRVTIHLTLKEFVAESLMNHLEALDTLITQINSDSLPGVGLEAWIEEKAFDLITPEDAGFVVSGVKSDECTVHLSEIIGVPSIQANDARAISPNEKYISMTATIELGIEICADYQQYQDSIQIEAIFDNDGIGMPTPYDCVSEYDAVDVEMSIIITDDDFSNAKIEILSLSGVGGSIDFGSTIRHA